MLLPKASARRVVLLVLAQTLLAAGAQQGAALKDTESATSYAVHGKILENEGRLEEARQEYEASLRLDPAQSELAHSFARLVKVKALSLANAGSVDEGLRLLEDAQGVLPADADLARDLGTLALNYKRLDIAERALLSARRIAPGDAGAIYALARLRLAQQRMPESESLLKRYLGIKPDDASAHYGLGHLLAMLLRNDEARVEFQRSVELAPAQTDSYVELADIQAIEGHCDKAVEGYQTVLARAPEHTGALTGLGTCRYKSRAYADAEPLLASAVRLAPDYWTARYYHGLTLARLGREAESKAELARAAELAPTQSQPPPR